MTDSRAMPPPMPPEVVIVGGGLAGLATAVGLCSHGLRITLLESRPRLGGRASSFPNEPAGALLDNCQHVSLGCCTNLADFCARVGIRSLFRSVREIPFLDPERRLSVMKAGWAPAPFHLTGSLLGAKYLSLSARLRVVYGMARLILAKRSRPGESMGDWLTRHGQGPEEINRYWRTVLVSALNDEPHRVDFALARKVFVDGFLRNRRGYEMEIPTAPLGVLYGDRTLPWLKERGAQVLLKTGVEQVKVDQEGMVLGVQLRNGQFLGADFVVLAVPVNRVSALLPEGRLSTMRGGIELDRFGTAPITSVHLWFDRPVCPFRQVALVDRLSHWVFDHSGMPGVIQPEQGGQYLQVVVSASGSLADRSNTEVRDAILSDLSVVWPGMKEAAVTSYRVVTEHHATFAVPPGINSQRPPQRTAIDGLFLAGDWTDTGWPSTMEGAVRSGYLAAEGILSDLCVPCRLLVPDLASGLLARLILGPAD